MGGATTTPPDGARAVPRDRQAGLLPSGRIVAGRFTVERLAGRGGMAEVYRARDSETDDWVALKVLTDPSVGRARFGREAQLLGGLEHPNIVRHVADGEDGALAYLAMEWLEGEDLAAKLKRGALPLADALAVVRQSAEALRAAHGLGIVHRDIKPANLFLVVGSTLSVKVLDFGIARLARDRLELTGANAVVGTVGYMAPEQARGEPLVTTGADVFALGCVLYECLTGEPAFSGEHAVAVLAKLLMAPVLEPSQLVPALPAWVDSLVAAMLAKDVDERLSDADAVLVALRERQVVERTRAEPMADELFMTSIVLVEQPSPVATPPEALATAPTLSDAIGSALNHHGAKAIALANGSNLVLVGDDSRAADDAVPAARVALALHGALPEARVALATGRAEWGARQLVGPVIDRAAELLAAERSSRSSGVAIDALTADLLGERFLVVGHGGRLTLRAEHASGEPRRLLGRSTPFVGRRSVMASLQATYEECVDERVARVVVIDGDAGIGKTRVGMELVRWLAERPEAPRLLIARARSLGGGAALGLVRGLLSHAAKLDEAGDDRARAGRLRSYFASLQVDAQDSLMTEVFGELLELPPMRPPSALLRSALAEPRIMRQRLKEVLFQWLDLLTREPTAMVIEDMHWADEASLSLLEQAHSAFRDRPLLLVGLERCGDHGHAKRFRHADVHRIHLPGLSQRACLDLAAAVLEQSSPSPALLRVVDRAGGNAFFLEELLRRMTREGDDDLPETVLALAEGRIRSQPPQLRRVLRAASIFGDPFPPDGVAAMLHGLSPAPTTLEHIDRLRSLELFIEERHRGEGVQWLTFRHALLGEAAYATSSPSDRQRGHLAAAEWLEAQGHREAVVLAEHFERAGAAERAIPWLLRAAGDAFTRLSLDDALSFSARARRAGSEGGSADVMEAQALAWSGDFDGSCAVGRRALAALPPGDPAWFTAASIVLLSLTMHRPDLPMDPQLIEQLVERSREAAPTPSFALALAYAVFAAIRANRVEAARSLLGILAGAAEEAADDQAIVGWFTAARVLAANWLDADLGSAWRLAQRGRIGFEEIGDSFGELMLTWLEAITLFESCRFGEAEERFARLARPEATLFQFMQVESFELRWRARLCLADDCAHEAITSSQALIDASTDATGTNAWGRAWWWATIAHAQLIRGELAEVGRAAQAMLEAPNLGLPHRALAYALSARVSLGEGHAAAALALVEQGVSLRAARSLDRALLRLTHAEALRLADSPEALRVIARAAARVRRVAQTLPDDARPGYFDYWVHRRTLELHVAWCRSGPPAAR